MCNRRQTLHRVSNGRSVKKKSPTSAWRRSMSSTRRTPQRPRRASRKRAAAAVVAAEAAEVVEVAGAAEAVAAVVVVVAAAAAAVCRGDLAGFARLDGFLITLTNAGGHGRVRQGRPGRSIFWQSMFWHSMFWHSMFCQSMFYLRRCADARAGRTAFVAGKVPILTS